MPACERHGYGLGCNESQTRKLTVSRALRLLLLFALAGTSAFGQGLKCPAGCGPGRWSTEAIDLSTARVKAPEDSRDITIDSPDLQKIARIVKDRWWIEIAGKKLFPRSKQDLILYPAEFAWAPNSQAFFITQRKGYSTGYHLEIYRIVRNRVRRVSGVSKTIAREFEIHHKCSNGQEPNIAGLKWVTGSDTVLVIAEVPPIGICKQLEYFGGYSVQIPGPQILERFSPQQLIDRWGTTMGERLQGNLQNLSVEDRITKP